MAKSKSISSFQGTLIGVTYVDSIAYGYHSRAPRGTYTPAKVNKAFEESTKDLIRANQYAKNIKNALDPIRGDLKDTTLWNRLHSHLRRELKSTSAITLKTLAGFQLSKTYSLGRLLQYAVKVMYDASRSELEVSFQFDTPQFPSLDQMDGFRITLAALYAGADQLISFSDSVVLPITEKPAKSVKTSLTVNLKAPDEFKTMLFCIKCEGTQEGLLSGNQRAKGMSIASVMDREEIDNLAERENMNFRG